MNLFDSHCHLESENFQNDLPQVMQRMAQAGVRRCVLAGSDLETSRRIVALARKHEGVYGAVGVHPHEAKTWTDETEAELEQMLAKPRVVAVGEIGLDYFYDLSPREKQREVLIRQLDLARRLNEGMVEEVRALLDRGVSEEFLFKLGLEYRFITQYLTGQIATLQEMRDLLSTAIKQFAKRQMTWFRRDASIHWLDMTADPAAQASELIEGFLFGENAGE